MPSLIAAVLLLMIAALAVLCLRNARAIFRDMNMRFEGIRSELERDASSMLNDFIESGGQPPSLGAEGHQRIHPHRSARRDDAGSDRDN